VYVFESAYVYVYVFVSDLSLRIPGLRIPGPRIPGPRIPGPRIPGLRIPGPRIPGLGISLTHIHRPVGSVYTDLSLCVLHVRGCVCV
jgi:hypothetical protein